ASTAGIMKMCIMRYSLLCILVLLAGCASISNVESPESATLEEGAPAGVETGPARIAAARNSSRVLRVESAPLESGQIAGPDSFAHRGLERLLALGRFFPEAIGAPIFQDGDWMVQVRGEWFRWADGRMLPAGQTGLSDEQFLPIWDPEGLD